MYQLTDSDDMVVCIESGAFIPRGHRLWADYEQYLAEGNVPAPAPLPYELYSPAHFSSIRASAWAWMTTWVVDRRYESIESCASYYNSGVQRYRMEARAMVAWRDAVCQSLEQMVVDPPAGIETWEQVRALLPQPESFEWPAEMELPMGVVESAVLE